MHQSDFFGSGQWICAGPEVSDKGHHYPAPVFWKEFILDAPVKNAELTIAGLGCYLAELNGQPVTQAVLCQYPSVFDKTIFVDSYQVTAQLHKGQNSLTVTLGNGWLNQFGTDTWLMDRARWIAPPRMCLRLSWELEDGCTGEVVSSEEFDAFDSPTTFNEWRGGEHFDARLSRQRPNCRKAVPAHVPKADYLKNTAHEVTVIRALAPQSITRNAKGYLLDFGENLSGWVRLKGSAPSGTQIAMRHGERVTDGVLDLTRLETFSKWVEFQTNRYTFAGEGVEEWRPSFTYQGFRYAQVEGWPDGLPLPEFTAEVVHTKLTQKAFLTSPNHTLNRLEDMTVKATLANFVYFLTDCPHREKNGWTGDAACSCEQVLIHFDPLASFRMWLKDVRDCQLPDGQLPGIVPTDTWGYGACAGPAWDQALPVLCWYSYVHTGCKEILLENADALRQYLVYLKNKRNERGLCTYPLGDWCSPLQPPGQPYPKCPLEVSFCICSYKFALLCAKIAKVIEDEQLLQQARQEADTSKKAFYSHLFDAASGTVQGTSQTGQAMALYYGILDQEDRPAALARLLDFIHDADDHLDTGILGTGPMLFTLSQEGYSELAWSMIDNKTFPSYRVMVDAGATTLWENFEGTESLNHHFFSEVSTWFYQSLAGINPVEEAPAFRSIALTPGFVKELSPFAASVGTPQGTVKSGWKFTPEGAVLDTASYPAGGTAAVTSPKGWQQVSREEYTSDGLVHLQITFKEDN